MPGKVPTESEVLGYIESLSNWGRWGPEDQLGTLNLLTPEKRVRAARLVRDGVTVSCARPLVTGMAADVTSPFLHYMVGSGEGWALGRQSPTGQQGCADFIGLVFHGHSVTHLDSLCHIFWNAKMYNGFSSELVTSREGATVEAIDLLKDGVVARGVLLDIPRLRGVRWLEIGDGIFPEDLEAAERACGVRVKEGDVLLVRTGHHRRQLEEGPMSPALGRPGTHAACIPWFRERGIAMLGADQNNEVWPHEYRGLREPIHQLGIVHLGLWLMDNVNLEELAAACEQRNQWEFLFIVAPLRIANGTGSPINPIAMF